MGNRYSCCYKCDKHGQDLNCHSTCEEYLKERAKQDRENQCRHDYLYANNFTKYTRRKK